MKGEGCNLDSEHDLAGGGPNFPNTNSLQRQLSLGAPNSMQINSLRGDDHNAEREVLPEHELYSCMQILAFDSCNWNNRTSGTDCLDPGCFAVAVMQAQGNLAFLLPARTVFGYRGQADICFAVTPGKLRSQATSSICWCYRRCYTLVPAAFRLRP